MAIIVEDGSIVSGANSYVTESELAQYATDRGVTLVGTASQLLYKSMDYIEAQSYIGDKSTQEQPLQWPRHNAYIDGYLFSSAAIPKELKEGQMMVAISIDAGVDPLSTVDRAAKVEVLGPMSTEYADNASDTQTIRSISSKLSKLLASSGGSMRALR